MRDEIFDILDKYKKIHVIGLSPKTQRASHGVSEYMDKAGYEIIGIRPGTDKIGDWPCYPSIAEAPGEIEILDVFRASEFVPQIIEEAIAKKVKVIWLQLGVSDSRAEQKAKEAGIKVVSNHCIKIEHAQRFSS